MYNQVFAERCLYAHYIKVAYDTNDLIQTNNNILAQVVVYPYYRYILNVKVASVKE